jgi:hypothetical protein
VSAIVYAGAKNLSGSRNGREELHLIEQISRAFTDRQGRAAGHERHRVTGRRQRRVALAQERQHVRGQRRQRARFYFADRPHRGVRHRQIDKLAL